MLGYRLLFSRLTAALAVVTKSPNLAVGVQIHVKMSLYFVTIAKILDSRSTCVKRVNQLSSFVALLRAAFLVFISRLARRFFCLYAGDTIAKGCLNVSKTSLAN